MELTQYLTLMFNDCANLCVFSDYETDELVFLNQAMERELQIFQDYKGKKWEEVLSHFVKPCDSAVRQRAMQGEVVEQRVYSLGLKAFLRSHTSFLELFGQSLLMTKFFLTASQGEKEEEKLTFDQAMTQCLDFLAFSDKKQSIQSMLELLGNYYTSEVCYIYEFNRKNDTISRAFYWCADREKTIIPALDDHESLTDFLSWAESEKEYFNLEHFLEDGEETSPEHRFFSRYNISNVTFNKLWNKNGSLVGIVGMNNRSAPFHDPRLLKAISLFVEERFHEFSVSRSMETMQETDLLTGFRNRKKYEEKVSEISKNPPETLGILFANLNGLRRTNEYFGFEMGDAQLKKTATMLQEFFPEEFYRTNGDEFVGFVPDCEKEIFENKVNKLQQKRKEGNQETTFSLGYSWGNEKYSVHDLINRAETVMVANKQEFYFNRENNDEKVEDLVLQDLFRAIEEEEFLVYLQPQILLKTEEIVGAEALVRRFDKREEKLIFPDQFISFYEKKAVIRHVDLYVLRKVCQLLRDWKRFGRAFPISVNFSRVTLMEEGIVDKITAILDEYETPHYLIILEVTQRMGALEHEMTTTLVEAFKNRGFKLSLDDFGSAGSNIVALSQLSVDQVKIDKSLVDNLAANDKNKVIVDSMVQMCNKFPDTHTLAEGIETQEQAEFLRSIHCNLGQGYLFSRPIPQEEFFDKYIKK